MAQSTDETGDVNARCGRNGNNFAGPPPCMTGGKAGARGSRFPTQGQAAPCLLTRPEADSRVGCGGGAAGWCGVTSGGL
jgi:hypothetical protein